MKDKCFNCNRDAVWSYMPGDEYACDECVPRGCSCNFEPKDGDWENEDLNNWEEMNKIKVRKNLSGHLEELEGSLDDAIQYLKSLKEKYSQYENLRFNVDYDWDNKQLYLSGFIDETDAEYEQRINREKKIQIDDERCQREQYEKLKAKFGEGK